MPGFAALPGCWLRQVNHVLYRFALCTGSTPVRHTFSYASTMPRSLMHCPSTKHSACAYSPLPSGLLLLVPDWRCFLVCALATPCGSRNRRRCAPPTNNWLPSFKCHFLPCTAYCFPLGCTTFAAYPPPPTHLVPSYTLFSPPFLLSAFSHVLGCAIPAQDYLLPGLFSLPLRAIVTLGATSCSAMTPALSLSILSNSHSFKHSWCAHASVAQPSPLSACCSPSS